MSIANSNLPELQALVSVQDLPLASTSDSTESGGHAVSTESGAHAVSTDRDEVVENDSLDEKSDCAPPSPKQPCIDSVPECHDLARYTGSAICLSEAGKYELLANPFRPGADSQRVQLGML